MWLIVGLGNPGRQYERTPHNLGFVTADILARRALGHFNGSRKWNADLAEGTLSGSRILLMKPLTYMNRSGDAVQPCAAYYQIPNNQVVVISDDVNLPYGRIRVREDGSHGGHNGLRNLIERLGGDDFPRVRIGCAPSKPLDGLVDHVLSPIWGEDVALADRAVDAAADCIECVLKSGVETAMQKFNGWRG